MGLGALLGAIFDEKITEEHKALFHDHLEKGGWMLMVHGEDEALDRAGELLHELHIDHVEKV
ncbi:hypothetical protein D3C87_2196040 [compost metagenome]